MWNVYNFARGYLMNRFVTPCNTMLLPQHWSFDSIASLTRVGEEWVIVGVIVELGPHAERELLHVWDPDLVLDVLKSRDKTLALRRVASILHILFGPVRQRICFTRNGLWHYFSRWLKQLSPGYGPNYNPIRERGAIFLIAIAWWWIIIFFEIVPLLLFVYFIFLLKFIRYRNFCFVLELLRMQWKILLLCLRA